MADGGGWEVGEWDESEQTGAVGAPHSGKELGGASGERGGDGGRRQEKKGVARTGEQGGGYVDIEADLPGWHSGKARERARVVGGSCPDFCVPNDLPHKEAVNAHRACFSEHCSALSKSGSLPPPPLSPPSHSRSTLDPTAIPESSSFDLVATLPQYRGRSKRGIVRPCLARSGIKPQLS